MNTPAHAVVNLLILGRRAPPKVQLTIVAGSFLPDLPIIAFYFTEKVLRQTPEPIIWSQIYYRAGWQNFFDLFNSLPLIGVGIIIALYTRARTWVAFFAAMGLHALGDLPLHHDDAHRHLYPFSDWRFHSPVSYWDPRHYGGIVAPLECLLVVVGSVVIYRCAHSSASKALVLILGAVYLAFLGFAFSFWG